eukprot:m.78317 g.78317  ORF g.78317 m.78317 type:complete len:813 (+) comp13245_c0_seq2:1291-3729(+)
MDPALLDDILARPGLYSSLQLEEEDEVSQDELVVAALESFSPKDRGTRLDYLKECFLRALQRGREQNEECIQFAGTLAKYLYVSAACPSLEWAPPNTTVIGLAKELLGNVKYQRIAPFFFQEIFTLDRNEHFALGRDIIVELGESRDAQTLGELLHRGRLACVLPATSLFMPTALDASTFEQRALLLRLLRVGTFTNPTVFASVTNFTLTPALLEQINALREQYRLLRSGTALSLTALARDEPLSLLRLLHRLTQLNARRTQLRYIDTETWEDMGSDDVMLSACCALFISIEAQGGPSVDPVQLCASLQRWQESALVKLDHAPLLTQLTAAAALLVHVGLVPTIQKYLHQMHDSTHGIIPRLARVREVMAAQPHLMARFQGDFAAAGQGLFRALTPLHDPALARMLVLFYGRVAEGLFSLNLALASPEAAAAVLRTFPQWFWEDLAVVVSFLVMYCPEGLDSMPPALARLLLVLVCDSSLLPSLHVRAHFAESLARCFKELNKKADLPLLAHIATDDCADCMVLLWKLFADLDGSDTAVRLQQRFFLLCMLRGLARTERFRLCAISHGRSDTFLKFAIALLSDTTTQLETAIKQLQAAKEARGVLASGAAGPQPTETLRQLITAEREAKSASTLVTACLALLAQLSAAMPEPLTQPEILARLAPLVNHSVTQLVTLPVELSDCTSVDLDPFALMAALARVCVRLSSQVAARILFIRALKTFPSLTCSCSLSLSPTHIPYRLRLWRHWVLWALGFKQTTTQPCWPSLAAPSLPPTRPLCAPCAISVLSRRRPSTRWSSEERFLTSFLTPFWRR